MATRHPRNRLIVALALSAGACALVMLSAWTTPSRLGAPLFWAWILTGLQVAALWAAGRGRSWAWLLGAAVQPVWIVYALCTGQVGFVPGCLVSAAVQLHNFLHDRPANGDVVNFDYADQRLHMRTSRDASAVATP